MQDNAQRVVVDDVDFSRLFQFHRILRAVTMGFQPPRLMVALFMIAALMTGGKIWDGVAGPAISPFGLGAGLAADGKGLGAFEASVTYVVSAFNALVRGVAYFEVPTIQAAAKNLFVTLPTNLWKAAPGFTICYGLYFVLVVAIGGGALSRMTACEFAGRERLRAGDAVQYAVGNWWKLAFAPLMPLVLAGGLALLLAALGWLFMLRGVDLLGGPLYGLAVGAGFVIAFLLIVYALGAMLLLPAVAVENCDPADAMQRSFAYVLARPLHLLGYGVTVLVGLTVGYLIAALFASTVLNITADLVGSWTNAGPMAQAGGYELFNLRPHMGAGSSVGTAALAWDQRWAAGWIGFWQTIVVGLAAAYVFANFFSAATILYLLMRKACDGQDVTEVWRPGMGGASSMTAMSMADPSGGAKP